MVRRLPAGEEHRTVQAVSRGWLHMENRRDLMVYGTTRGVPAAALTENDLLQELDSLHRTRHDVFLRGSTEALVRHTERTRELEDEYLRRHPERQISPARLRADSRVPGRPTPRA